MPIRGRGHTAAQSEVPDVQVAFIVPETGFNGTRNVLTGLKQQGRIKRTKRRQKRGGHSVLVI